MACACARSSVVVHLISYATHAEFGNLNHFGILIVLLRVSIQKRYEKESKPVVVTGYSGGTINSYAFLMSQTLEWRQKYVLAHVQKNPVFGGTISSINSVLHGWGKGAMDLCSGRKAAMFIPSVLWMWPRPGETQYDWNKTEVLVYSPTKNYTVGFFKA